MSGPEYTGEPRCTRCQGALLADNDICLCGGRSQYQRGGQDQTDFVGRDPRQQNEHAGRAPVAGRSVPMPKHVTVAEALEILRQRYEPAS